MPARLRPDLIDEVHGASRERDARLQRLPLGVEALEGGQQRRVHVQQPPTPRPYEGGREDAHESGQAHQLHSCGGRVRQWVLGGPNAPHVTKSAM